MDRTIDVFEKDQGTTYYLTQEFTDKFVLSIKPNSKTGEIGYLEKGTGKHQSSTIYDGNFIARTIQAGDWKAPLKVTCPYVEGTGYIVINGEKLSIKKLNPLECWRLQGFTDEDYHKSAEKISKTKLYERAGRGICVPMLEDIFSKFEGLLDEEIKLFEAFAGVGSQRMALRNLKANYTSVGILEVDKNAILAYDAIHNNQTVQDYDLTKEEKIKEMRDMNIAYNFSTYKDEMPRSEKDIDKLYLANKRSHNYGDISKLKTEDLPDFNFFTYSFPCKNISTAGNQLGLDKGSGTQSSLLWECEKIIRDKRPKYLMMENVKNLCGKNNMENFQVWIDILKQYGYESEWQVYNAKDYGTPQNRERVIMMSRLIEG